VEAVRLTTEEMIEVVLDHRCNRDVLLPPVVAPVLVLPPVRAPAPAMVVPPHLDRFQCPNFQINCFCPAHELVIYDHGYQPPDQGLLELLDIPRRRQQSSRPQNPRQPLWAHQPTTSRLDLTTRSLSVLSESFPLSYL
jgi:hypothetical protein